MYRSTTEPGADSKTLPRFVERTPHGLRIRRPYVWLQVAVLFVTATCMTLISQRTDAWFRAPMIIGFVTAQALLINTSLRRRLRAAKSGQERAAASRISLSDLLLYLTAAAVLVGSYSVNRTVRERELARRQAVDQAALLVLGAGGTVERDHRGRLNIGIQDGSFDDARMARLADLLAEDNDRLGITWVQFLATGGSNAGAWPNLTDASVDRLLDWRELRTLYLVGTSISASGAERLTNLPELQWLEIEGGFDDEAARRMKSRRPNLLIGGPSDAP